jgi:hypothetical protein
LLRIIIPMELDQILKYPRRDSTPGRPPTILHKLVDWGACEGGGEGRGR